MFARHVDLSDTHWAVNRSSQHIQGVQEVSGLVMLTYDHDVIATGRLLFRNNTGSTVHRAEGNNPVESHTRRPNDDSGATQVSTGKAFCMPYSVPKYI